MPVTTNLEPNPNWLGRDANFTIMANQRWREHKDGPLAANVNAGAFLPIALFSNRTSDIVQSLLAQDPESHLPKPLHPTLLAGYKQQVQTMAKMLQSRDSAELEWLFSGRESFAMIMLKATSRGTVYLSPRDDGASQGHAEPVVDWRTFSNPLDGELTAEVLRFARWFMRSAAMVETFHPREVTPGEAVQGQAEMVEWIRGRISPSNGHMVGTAKLGPRALGGVVGPTLLVHGVAGLSVADNSIMPLIPGTHTSSTAYAIGERAAEIILKRADAAGSEAQPGKEEPVPGNPASKED
jgi:choline dehydrogenase-like flavoprotein